MSDVTREDLISAATAACEAYVASLTEQPPPPPPPPPPLVADAGGPYKAVVGTPITLDGTGSTGPIHRSTWTLDGVFVGYGLKRQQTFERVGTFALGLTVEDEEGDATANDETQLTVAAVPPPPVTADAGGPYVGIVGKPVQFDGSGSTNSDETQYKWDFGDGVISYGMRPTHIYESAGTRQVTLVVSTQHGEAVDRTTATVTQPQPAGTYYVSPTGRDGADGSLGDPYSLRHALETATIAPGTTLLFLPGEYIPGGDLTTTLTGTKEAPIICKPFIGGVVFDFIMPDNGYVHWNIQGQWSVWQGFEFTNSDPSTRMVRGDNIYRRGSIEVLGSHVSFRNNVVHDLMKGISFWTKGVGGECYGNIEYNCGVQEHSHTPHGHGGYFQNRDGELVIEENLFLANLSHGVHIYTEQSWLDNITVTSNFVANNGHKPAANNALLCGGGRGATGATIDDNFLEGVVSLDYHNPNTSLTFDDNLMDGELRLTHPPTESLSVQRNVVYRSVSWQYLARVSRPLTDRTTWDSNTYHSQKALPFAFSNSSKSFSQWQEVTGADNLSTMSTGPPEDSYRLLLNRYDPTRAFLYVFNWHGDDGSCSIDLSGWLGEDDACAVYHCYDLEHPVDEVDGREPVINLQMRDVPAPEPIGYLARKRPVMPKTFAAFLLLKAVQ